MKVLVGCETSGVVRDAFIRAGHDAWSCDLLPSESAAGPHLQCDVLTVLDRGWDLGIFHPDCTYLCSSGLHWNTRRPGRAALTEQALTFVRTLLAAPIPRLAVENPIGCISSRIRRPDQIIQPHWFGHDASKATCLWLKNLPPLQPTRHIAPHYICPQCGRRNARAICRRCGVPSRKPVWANQTPSGQNKLGPSADRWQQRARTYSGIGGAFATQWG